MKNIITFQRFLQNAIDCGKIDVPNGRVIPANDTAYPANVTYICDPGFDLVGNLTRMCQSNRIWTGTNSSCAAKGNSCIENYLEYISYFVPVC